MFRLLKKKIKSFEVLFIFLVFMLVSICGVEGKIEIKVNTTIKQQCKDKTKILKWDTSSVSMQNIPYMWTHQQELEHWRYQELKENNRPVPTTFLTFPEPDCSIIVYDTTVQVPKQILTYMPASKMQTHIQKTVCSTKKNLIENVKFSKILFLGSFTVKLNAVIRDDISRLIFLIFNCLGLSFRTSPIGGRWNELAHFFMIYFLISLGIHAFYFTQIFIFHAC